MNYLSAGLLALALALGGCATENIQNSQAREAPWSKAAAARTRSDHEALVAWYLREAESATEKAAVHRKLRDSYASSSGLYDVSGMVGHCTNLIGQYERAARESAALSERHRRLAGEAKE